MSDNFFKFLADYYFSKYLFICLTQDLENAANYNVKII